jgi:diguanylate cyclase (GGDEF)-like protein
METVTLAARRALAEWGEQHQRAMASLGLEITTATLSERPLSGLLGSLCQQTAARFGADRASVFLIEDGRLAPMMSRRVDGGSDEALWERCRAAKEPLLLVEAVMADGIPQLATSTTSELIAGSWARSFDLGSALAVALGRPPDLVGVLVLDAKRPAAFVEAQKEQAANIAAEVGRVIDWARFVETFSTVLAAAAATTRLLQEGSGAATVKEAATVVARVISAALGAERNAVLYFPGGNLVRVATVDMAPEIDAAVHRAFDGFDPAKSPNIVQARTERTPQFCTEDDVVRPGGLVETLGLRSWAGIPLLSGSGLIGHIVCGDVTRARRWSWRERRLVADLAGEGGLIIEAARLREADRDHRAVLAHEATHDQLTGLANRRMLREHLSQALAVGRRTGTHCAVLLVDLNRFKEVNDAYGHHRGDELLIEVAIRVTRLMRRSDLAARLGGDEFAVLLPGTDRPGAVEMARKVSAALNSTVALPGLHVGVAASVGVAVFPEDGDTSDLLLQRADAAMYQAKRDDPNDRRS